MVTPYEKMYFRIMEYSEDGRRINDMEKISWEESKDGEPTPKRTCIGKDISKIHTRMDSLAKAKWERSVFLF